MFNHADAFGSAPAHRLTERVKVERIDTDTAPRAFGDYVVSIEDNGLPQGVTLTKLIS